MDLLGHQVHPMVQMSKNDETLQGDNLPIHRARSVKSWCMMMYFNIFPGQHNHQA